MPWHMLMVEKSGLLVAIDTTPDNLDCCRASSRILDGSRDLRRASDICNRSANSFQRPFRCFKPLHLLSTFYTPVNARTCLIMRLACLVAQRLDLGDFTSRGVFKSQAQALYSSSDGVEAYHEPQASKAGELGGDQPCLQAHLLVRCVTQLPALLGACNGCQQNVLTKSASQLPNWVPVLVPHQQKSWIGWVGPGGTQHPAIA